MPTCAVHPATQLQIGTCCTTCCLTFATWPAGQRKCFCPYQHLSASSSSSSPSSSSAVSPISYSSLQMLLGNIPAFGEQKKEQGEWARKWESSCRRMVPNCENEIMGGDCGNELLDAHNVRVIGNGSQVLVLGHGFGSDQSVWQFILPYFVNDFKVVLFDLMGAGTTKSHNFSFARYATLHAYADDLLMILDEMEIESCVFVGHSMSGMIACIASIERPQVFQKLVLLSASPRWISRAVPSSHCVPATVWTISSAIYNIFPLGCCDHRFNFLQLAVLTVIAQHYWSSTDQLQEL